MMVWKKNPQTGVLHYCRIHTIKTRNLGILPPFVICGTIEFKKLKYTNNRYKKCKLCLKAEKKLKSKGV